MIVDATSEFLGSTTERSERFISPLVQRKTIERWAQLHGAVVGQLFEELDESGARADPAARSAVGVEAPGLSSA